MVEKFDETVKNKKSRKDTPSMKNLRLLFKISLITLTLTLVHASAFAATITVTDTDDNQFINSKCSIREALANINFDTNTRIDCKADVSVDPYGTNDKILLKNGGTYSLTRSGAPEDLNSVGDLDIRDTQVLRQILLEAVSIAEV